MLALSFTILSTSSSEAKASGNHFLSPEFHGLQHCVLSICLLSSNGLCTWIGDCFSALLLSLMALRLALVGQPFLALFSMADICQLKLFNSSNIKWFVFFTLADSMLSLSDSHSILALFFKFISPG